MQIYVDLYLNFWTVTDINAAINLEQICHYYLERWWGISIYVLEWGRGGPTQPQQGV